MHGELLFIKTLFSLLFFIFDIRVNWKSLEGSQGGGEKVADFHFAGEIHKYSVVRVLSSP